MDLASLQARLSDACRLNAPPGTTPHVVVMLPSYNIGASLLAHYAGRIAALEHRYLLAVQMLPRLPGAEAVFVTCEAPAPEVLDYYFRLMPEDARADAERRLTVVEVPERGDAPVAAKLLSHVDLLVGVRNHIGGRPAFIEPWNVGIEEIAVALAVQAPIRGTTPDLRWIGFKSAGRRLFHAANVPTPCGVEDVHDVTEVQAAIRLIRDQRPLAAGVVVKLDDSVAGDGNVIIRFDESVDDALQRLPDWYVADLASGGVVEELVTGVEFSSPSVQLELEPDGRVVVLATHEQVLGGDNGQVFLGCRFPADPMYAAELAQHGMAAGRELIRRGAVGRVSVDFAAARDEDGRWHLYALEMNLRKGGTTHPYSVLRHLVPGAYEPGTGGWRAECGQPTYYQCSDNLLDPDWKRLPQGAAIKAVDNAGLTFDRATGVGVVLHMLPGLPIDGRIGATAIANRPEQAAELLAAVADTLTAAVPAQVARRVTQT
jgi:hypothetical protein